MPNVLLVVTSHTRLGSSDQLTGAWLEELAQAYYTLAQAGHPLSIASPGGGAAPLDPASATEPWLSQTGRRFLQDATAMSKLRSSQPLSNVASSEYDALYIVGGAGAAFDLPENSALGRLLEAMLAANKPVAAVCHGAAGLAAAKGPAGKAFVAGRKVTAFSNVEEAQVGYIPHLPALPENLLRSLGADYSCAQPWQEHVVVDGLLMSGQNPASAAPLAAALAAKLR